MANERKCIVDNTKYEYCGKCKKYNSEETWRYLFCSENCKHIYAIYDEYRQGRLDANSAVEQFNQCEMPEMDKLHEIIKPVIEKAYSENKPVVVVPEVEEETTVKNKKKHFKKNYDEVPVIEETPIIDIVNEINEELI